MRAKYLQDQFNVSLRQINMVTPAIIIAFIGNLLLKTATSAVIDYEPIKITVNENFNPAPGHVSSELQALEPGFVHQGANFYFKPQLNLPTSYIPPHIEDLITLIEQHHHSCAKDASKVIVKKDKLIEILKPFVHPLSDKSKETRLETVFENENNLEIVKPLQMEEPIKNYDEPKPMTSELVVIPEAPVLPPLTAADFPVVVEEVKKDKSVIFGEPMGIFPTVPEIAEKPIEEPIINYIEPKPVTSVFVDIPEAPVLPPLPLDGFPAAVEKQLKEEKPEILKESSGVFSTIPKIAVRPAEEVLINYIEPKLMTSELLVIPKAPVLPPLTSADFPVVVEKVKKEKSVTMEEPTGVFPTIPEIEERPIAEPIINYNEPKPTTSEFVVIPEAPVLPPLPLVGLPSTVEEELKKEKSVILKESMDVFPTIPEKAERPIEEPIINYVEPKPVTSEFVIIPEAPVLPPLPLDGFSSAVEKESKDEKSVILKESTGVFSTIPKIAVRPAEEALINYIEPKLMTSELLVIPKAPVLPPLTSADFPVVVEKVKKEKSVIVEEPTGVFPTIPEIAERPIAEPIINYNEPKPTTSELVVIPEAPVLPPLPLVGLPSTVEEELKKEKSEILKESMDVFPTIPEKAERPIEEPIINYVEPKPVTSEFVIIPEAPVLPPLPLDGFSSAVEKESKDEKPEILKESSGVFSTIPKIAVRPAEEVLINYIEPKLMTSELLVIPKAPVLPPLTSADFPVVVEKVKKEKSVIMEEPTGVFPTIPEIEERPIAEPIINYNEPKPTTSEFVVIPEAPVLPPLPLVGLPSTVEEELKKEKSVILKESMDVFPTIPEKAERPIEEPIINYVEPKPVTSEFVIIPEAPVLPPLPLDGFSSAVEKESKDEKSVILKESTGVFSTIPKIAVRPAEEALINYIEPKLMTSELLVIPKAPVLPPLTSADFPVVVEKVKKEKSVIVEEPTGVFPAIPEIAERPIAEPIINYNEPKPTTSELVVIPEAPVLPPLSIDGFPSAVEELKKDKSVILKESMGVFSTIPKIAVRPVEEPIVNNIEPKPMTSELQVIPKAPVLPLLTAADFRVVVEEVKKDKSVTLEEPTGLFPTIPEIAERPTEQPIISYIEPKSMTSEFVVIPEAPVLPPLPLDGFLSAVEKELKEEKPVILKKSSGVFSTIPKIAVRPVEEPIINNIEPKPMTSELLVIPKAPVLPPLTSADFPDVVEEVKKEKAVILEEPTEVFPTIPEMFPTIPKIAESPLEEPIISYIEPKPMTLELVDIPEAPLLPPLSSDDFSAIGEVPVIPDITAQQIPDSIEVSENAKSFALENNMSPVVAEEFKIEIPILLEESIDVYPPIAKISSGSSRQNPEITNSYVVKKIPQPNSERFIRVKETLPPTIISKPSNNMGVFSYKPILSHLSNRTPKAKRNMFQKPASLERFLLPKYPFTLPVTPFPKLNQTAKSPIIGNKNQFLYPTSYAHDVVEKRIASNMAFKKTVSPKRVKIYIRSNVPKGPSYL